MELFSPDSPLMEFLGKVADILILNLLCLLCCIPVITAGAAFSAKFYVSMKMVRKEEPRVWDAYWKAFGANFRQATRIWLPLVGILALLAFDWYQVLYGTSQSLSWGIKLLLFFMTYFVWSICYVIFPFIARFEISIGEALKGAITFSLLQLPKLVLIFFAIFIPIVVSIWYVQWALAILALSTTVTLYYASQMFVGEFAKLLPQEE